MELTPEEKQKNESLYYQMGYRGLRLSMYTPEWAKAEYNQGAIDRKRERDDGR